MPLDDAPLFSPSWRTRRPSRSSSLTQPPRPKKSRARCTRGGAASTACPAYPSMNPVASPGAPSRWPMLPLLAQEAAQDMPEHLRMQMDPQSARLARQGVILFSASMSEAIQGGVCRRTATPGGLTSAFWRRCLSPRLDQLRLPGAVAECRCLLSLTDRCGCRAFALGGVSWHFGGSGASHDE